MLKRSEAVRISQALAICGVVGVCAGHARAKSSRIDPNRVHTYSLRPAALNQTLSDSPLPSVPSVAWRVRVAGGIAFPPAAVPGGGAVMALTTPVLVEYDSHGKLVWTARLGVSPAATSPLLLGSGQRLVFTQNAEALGFSERGRLISRTQLPLGNLETAPLISAADDGGLLIASGRRLSRLDASLNVAFSTRSDADIRALVATGSGSVVITTTGSVLEVTRDGHLRQAGSFAGRVDAVGKLSAERLIAIVDGKRLSEFDLSSGVVKTDFAEADQELLPGLAANERAGARAITVSEFLVAVGVDGREAFRVTLPSGGPASRSAVSEMVLDAAGTVIIARSGADLVTIRADGSLVRTEGTACAEPLRPLGADAGTALFACRSGILFGLVERRDDLGTPPKIGWIQ